MKKSKAEKIGRLLGFVLLKIVDLMYQNNTAYNFLKGLVYVIDKGFKKRQMAKIKNKKRVHK